MADVSVNKTNGNLGRVVSVSDGASALIASAIAVATKFALGDVLILTQLADAENLGIDAAYDTDNGLLLHNTIKDFYSEAPAGTELYVMPVADTVTMAEMLDKDGNHAPTLLEGAAGKIRLLAVARVPDDAYNPVFQYEGSACELDEDVFAAIATGQLLYNDQWTKHRPINIFVEGRDFQGTVNDLFDLRDGNTVEANHVSCVLAAHPDVSTTHTAYAGVGLALGREAAIPVQRNAGRVKDDAVSWIKAGISGKVANSALSDTDLKALSDKGYWVLRSYDGKAGYRWYDDWTCTPNNDDYNCVSRCRPIDKAARIARQVYINELLDDVEVDPDTGKMNPAVILYYQGTLEDNIIRAMKVGLQDSELSGVEAVVDPDQNILSTDKVRAKLKLVPKGMTRAFEIEIAYENPNNS